MLFYILRRLAIAFSVAVTVSIVSFMLLHLSGDLATAIAGATLHIAPWGGHGMNVTEPDAFNAVLLDFLDRHAAR